MRVRTHPGEVLRYDYLEPLNMSASALAEKIEVPANRISEIMRGHRGMTADTAVRLASYFDTTPEFWMDLQTAHDLSKVVRNRFAQTAHGAQEASKKVVAKVKRKKTRRTPVVPSRRTGTHG